MSSETTAKFARKPVVALLLDHIESDYHVELIEGAMRVANRRGARTLIIPGGALDADGKPGRARGFIYRYLALTELDGLMVFGGSLSNYSGISGFERFYRQLPRVPTVVVGLDTPAAMCVAVNNHHGVSQVIDHLVYEHGRKKIAFIEGPAGSTESRIRRQAYLDSVERHQLHLDNRYLVPGGLGREQGIDAVISLLDDRHFSPAELNAIVCVNDDVALGVLDELKRRDIEVPTQIAVVGFDDAPNAHTALPPLTTVSQRVYEQAEVAMNRLLDSIGNRSVLYRDELLPDFIARRSCGCAPRMSNDSGSSAAVEATTLLNESEQLEARLRKVERGRLADAPGWEERVISALFEEYDGQRGSLMAAFSDLSSATGESSIDVCHEVLSELRKQALARLASDDAQRDLLEDGFQEGRLALANRSLFHERERQAAHAHHLREITRACLARAHGADLDELAVALDEQLPLFGINRFVVSRGSEDVLQVVARSTSPGGPVDVVTTTTLGRDLALLEEPHTVVLPLSFGERQVGLAAFSYTSADPYVFEQLRDLLSMALGVDATRDSQRPQAESGYHVAHRSEVGGELGT